MRELMHRILTEAGYLLVPDDTEISSGFTVFGDAGHRVEDVRAILRDQESETPCGAVWTTMGLYLYQPLLKEFKK